MLQVLVVAAAFAGVSTIKSLTRAGFVLVAALAWGLMLGIALAVDWLSACVTFRNRGRPIADVVVDRVRADRPS